MFIYCTTAADTVGGTGAETPKLTRVLPRTPTTIFPLSTYHVYFFPFGQDNKKRAEKQPGRPAAGRQAGKYATNSHSKHARKFLQFAGRSSVGFEFEGVLAMRCVAKCNRMRIENVQQRMA